MLPFDQGVLFDEDYADPGRDVAGLPDEANLEMKQTDWKQRIVGLVLVSRSSRNSTLKGCGSIGCLPWLLLLRGWRLSRLTWVAAGAPISTDMVKGLRRCVRVGRLRRAHLHSRHGLARPA